MLARLGNVIYWACCGLAALTVIPIALVLKRSDIDATEWLVMWVIVAALVWLFGRATKYVLAGK